MDIEGILAITLIFGGATLFLLAISPIGRALAERIRGQASTSTDPQLLADVDALRHDVAELQERVDFTERLLAQREHGQVGERGKAG